MGNQAIDRRGGDRLAHPVEGQILSPIQGEEVDRRDRNEVVGRVAPSVPQGLELGPAHLAFPK